MDCWDTIQTGHFDHRDEMFWDGDVEDMGIMGDDGMDIACPMEAVTCRQLHRHPDAPKQTSHGIPMLFDGWHGDHDATAAVDPDVIFPEGEVFAAGETNDGMETDMFAPPRDSGCFSPKGPVEELSLVQLDQVNDDRCFAPLLFSETFHPPSPTARREALFTSFERAVASATDHGDDGVLTSLEDRYHQIVEKLQASMELSQETRHCLTMTTPKTKDYMCDRRPYVHGVLTSIEVSSKQLQFYLHTLQEKKMDQNRRDSSSITHDLNQRNSFTMGETNTPALASHFRQNKRRSM